MGFAFGYTAQATRPILSKTDKTAKPDSALINLIFIHFLWELEICARCLAEREGFEPSIELFNPITV
jgi:hypothetical protein